MGVAAEHGRRRAGAAGVLDVEVNLDAQSATVVFDPRRTSLAELRRWVTECDYHCAGQSVPTHVCDPMAEPDPPAEEVMGGQAGHESHGAGVAVLSEHAEQARAAHAEQARAAHAEQARAAHAEHTETPVAPEGIPSPHEVMGHGGNAEMSMAAKVADMRNRFLVALPFSPIVIWSSIGEDVFGLDTPVPFGLRQDVWAMLLSLPVIFYSLFPRIPGNTVMRSRAPDEFDGIRRL